MKAELESTSGSFQRIKLVMDAWCAFWFWPLENVANLPSRDAFLTSARLLLGAEAPKDKLTLMMMRDRLRFDIEGLLAALGDGQVPDTDILSANVPWFGMARTLSGEQNFHHWELVFPEVLGAHAQQDGFDLILGNPPWLKVTWTDAACLAELQPLIGIRGGKTADLNQQREPTLQKPADRGFYAKVFRNDIGSVCALGSHRLFPVLSGV